MYLSILRSYWTAMGAGRKRKGCRVIGNQISDCVCIFHGELEPPEVGSRCVDEAASKLYEDLSEDRGEERYEDPGDR